LAPTRREATGRPIQGDLRFVYTIRDSGKPILAPLDFTQRRAAKRGKWHIVESKEQRLAADPLRYRDQWLHCAATADSAARMRIPQLPHAAQLRNL